MTKKYLLLLIVACSVIPGVAAGCAIDGSIDKHRQVDETCDESWVVHGNIDDGSTVTLTSLSASIKIDGKIGGGSHVNLIAPNASILIGGGIDGGSTVTLSTASGAGIRINGNISGGSMVCLIAGGSVFITGEIDGEGTEVYWQGTSITARLGKHGVPVLEKAPCSM
jgi:hypothetical protein